MFTYKRLKHLSQVEGPQLTRAHLFDAGADIRASEEVIILPKKSGVIPTGIAVDIQPGYEGTVRARSGLAFKEDIVAFHGTVDAGFTGHLQVKIFNHGYTPYKISKGDKVAQLVVSPVIIDHWDEVEELPSIIALNEHNDGAIRGESGFGSSGK